MIDFDTLWDYSHPKETEQKFISLLTQAEESGSIGYLAELNIGSTLVEQYKVQLTPTIMIEGIVLDDPFDYNKIKEVIDQELEDNN
ncbi:hypothetical protein PMSD_22575 [Paenibacillus macquariensis subsp. defensor]|nr:hypothetical protein PMSD_22575 [Paenibacillus macquariensis subsp. defensor]